MLYIRHAATDFSQNDAQMKSFEDCASQRNLTDAGRAEARRIGESVRKLRIPVGRVLASPFCRTVETAMLVFGKAQKMNEVRGGPVKSDDPKRYDGLRKLMATLPPKGTNLVISSHGNRVLRGGGTALSRRRRNRGGQAREPQRFRGDSAHPARGLGAPRAVKCTGTSTYIDRRLAPDADFL